LGDITDTHLKKINLFLSAVAYFAAPAAESFYTAIPSTGSSGDLKKALSG
jgi:hypothetical protein